MQYIIKDECSRACGTKISAIVEALAGVLCPPKYMMRFKHPTTLTFADGRLKIGAPSLFIASRIKDHFLNEISLAVRAVTERFLSKLGTARLSPKILRAYPNNPSSLVILRRSRRISPKKRRFFTSLRSVQNDRPEQIVIRIGTNTFGGERYEMRNRNVGSQ